MLFNLIIVIVIVIVIVNTLWWAHSCLLHSFSFFLSFFHSSEKCTTPTELNGATYIAYEIGIKTWRMPVKMLKHYIVINKFGCRRMRMTKKKKRQWKKDKSMTIAVDEVMLWVKIMESRDKSHILQKHNRHIHLNRFKYVQTIELVGEWTKDLSKSQEISSLIFEIKYS